MASIAIPAAFYRIPCRRVAPFDDHYASPAESGSSDGECVCGVAPQLQRGTCHKRRSEREVVFNKPEANLRQIGGFSHTPQKAMTLGLVYITKNVYTAFGWQNLNKLLIIASWVSWGSLTAVNELMNEFMNSVNNLLTVPTRLSKVPKTWSTRKNRQIW